MSSFFLFINHTHFIPKRYFCGDLSDCVLWLCAGLVSRLLLPLPPLDAADSASMPCSREPLPWGGQSPLNTPIQDPPRCPAHILLLTNTPHTTVWSCRWIPSHRRLPASPSPDPEPTLSIISLSPPSSIPRAQPGPPISPPSLRSSPPPAVQMQSAACPNCGDAFSSENAVSEHLDGCLSAAGGARSRTAAYLAGNPPAAAVDVVKKLLGNLLNEPRNDKYRRVRLGNPRIKEAVADREGGLELFEAVGFTIGDENGELFAVMDTTPDDARLGGIRQAVLLLERSHPSAPLQTPVEAASKESCRSGVDEEKEVNKIVDRQIRVFFNVPGSSVAETDAPDSFYQLSNAEVSKEAKMRRERLEQSRLLIPKSYKEKQALAARQKYKQAVIRVQFPDGVTLQGVFLPTEATGSLYEFVASVLKQPGLEFDLICPALPRSRVLPHSPNVGERARTLQDEGLVPSALLKFRPNETDSVVFTGLLDNLLEASEPFTAASS